MHARSGEAGQDRNSVPVQGCGDGGGGGLERRAPGVADVLEWYGAVDAVGETVHDGAAGECGERGPWECVDASQVGSPDRPHWSARDEPQRLLFRFHSAEFSRSN